MNGTAGSDDLVSLGNGAARGDRAPVCEHGRLDLWTNAERKRQKINTRALNTEHRTLVGQIQLVRCTVATNLVLGNAVWGMIAGRG